METSEFCVYTIANGDELAQAENEGGQFTRDERTRWVLASQLLRQATSESRLMPVLFADATDCSRLIYWGVLDRVVVGEIGDTTTKYTVRRVFKLDGEFKPQDLRLRSTGNTIAPGYIRPYAVCYTPDFLSVEPMEGALDAVDETVELEAKKGPKKDKQENKKQKGKKKDKKKDKKKKRTKDAKKKKGKKDNKDKKAKPN